MQRILLVLALVATLSACGGLNRAVAVLPNTLDDLGRGPQPQAPSRTVAAARSQPPAPVQPGDAALAVRP